MVDVIVFHHAQGLTPDVHAFADELRAAGHRVTTPDLFEGATFGTVEEGVAHAHKIGFGTIIERGVAAAPDGPAVYAGFSMGALPAEQLALTRQDALAAILYHGAVPAAEFGTSWPASVALQIHINEHDPWCEEDLPAAREMPGELFVYGGSTHLVFEPDDAKLVRERTLELLSTFATTA